MSGPRFEFPRVRFRCLACGRCCRGWDISVQPEEEERLERFRPGSIEVRTVHHPFRRERLALKRMRMVDGGCVFLEPDDHCAYHAAQGADAKPLTCRWFPVSGFTSRDGVVTFFYSWACPGVEPGMDPDQTQRAELIRLWEETEGKKYRELTGGSVPESPPRFSRAVDELLADSRFRVRHSLRAAAGLARQVDPRGEAPLPPLDRVDLMSAVPGRERAFLRRYLTATLLLYPEPQPDRFDPRLALDRLRRLIAMLRPGGKLIFRPEGWRYRALALEELIERLPAAAEAVQRDYLRELVRRGVLVPPEVEGVRHPDFGLRCLVLLWRASNLLAAAESRRRGEITISPAAMLEACRQTDRHFAGHSSLRLPGYLGFAFRRLVRRMLGTPDFYATLL